MRRLLENDKSLRLQWGPGLISRESWRAEVHPDSEIVELQWGPGLISRESEAGHEAAKEYLKLQWGPGLISRESPAEGA